MPSGVRLRLKARKPQNYPENPKTLGQYLKRERAIRALHQDEAARLLGVSEATYHNWENDQVKPGMTRWPAVIRFLGYDPSPEPKTLGERMTAKRRVMGWTMRAAANVVGIDEGTWRRSETGKRVSEIRTSMLVEGVV